MNLQVELEAQIPVADEGLQASGRVGDGLRLSSTSSRMERFKIWGDRFKVVQGLCRV